MAKERNQQPFVPKKLAIKMPPGYRFKPTDEELVFHYLRRKVYNETLPPNIIEEVELYSYSPDDLTKDKRKGMEWYFFTPRERKYPNGGRPKRTAGDGFWKATGADRKIKIKGKTVGLKKTLVYYEGKPPNGKKKTNWIMHEFVLSDPPRRERAGVDDMRLDDWVLCRIYNKKKDLKGALESGIDHDQKQQKADVHSRPADATQVEQHCGIIPLQAEVMKEHQNGSIPPRIEQFDPQNSSLPPRIEQFHQQNISDLQPQIIEQFHQVGDYNNMLPPQQQAYGGYDNGMPLYNDNGYGASSSGLTEFHHYYANTMFPQQVIATVAPSIPPRHPLMQQPPGSVDPSFFTEEDRYLLNMDFGI